MTFAVDPKVLQSAISEDMFEGADVIWYTLNRIDAVTFANVAYYFFPSTYKHKGGVFLSHIDRGAVDNWLSGDTSIIDVQHLLNRVAPRLMLKDSQSDDAVFQVCTAAIAHAWTLGLKASAGVQIRIETGDEDGVGPYATFWQEAG